MADRVDEQDAVGADRQLMDEARFAQDHARLRFDRNLAKNVIAPARQTNSSADPDLGPDGYRKVNGPGLGRAYRTNSRIARSRPSRVSGYMRPPTSWRIMRTE